MAEKSTLGQIAELEAQEEAKADIFYTQQKAIEALEKILERQDSGTAYVSPPQPQPKSTNYMIYIGIGLLVLFLFRKKVGL